MKRFGVILLAVLLVFGMTQCKKKKSSSSSSSGSSSAVTITVEVQLNSFAKFIIDPNGGSGNVAMEFEKNDVLYVGNAGKYVGKMTYSNGVFKGSLDKKKLSEEDYLHFYFLGNKKPGETMSAYSTSECSVNISEQFEKLPLIAYGRSTELYQKTVKAYSTTLNNKCALVKFTTPSIKPSNAIKITGMNNVVTLDFAANIGETVGEPFAFSVDETNNGAIVLKPESDVVKWATLLPQPEVTNAMASAFAYVTESNFTVRAITANGYYGEGIHINLVSGGAVEGEFSVSKTKKVYFSSANLMATTSDNWSTWTWSFMPHQYEMVETGDVNENYNGLNSGGLFGWATSGKNLRGTETDYYYKPFNTNDDGAAYGPNGLYSLIAGNNKNGDWGVFNSTEITNGGGYTTWRTLMKEEWEYLVNFDNNENYRRVTVNGTKKVPYGKATVMGVKGLLLLPDDWDGSMHQGFVYGESAWANEYNGLTTPTWPEMEATGVVFLPDAGTREGTSVNNHGTEGGYWTVMSGAEAGKAYMFMFDDAGASVFPVSRSMGLSVRLVRNAE